MRQFFAGSGCAFFSAHDSAYTLWDLVASNPWLHHGTLLRRHPNPNRPPPRLCLIGCDHTLETAYESQIYLCAKNNSLEF